MTTPPEKPKMRTNPLLDEEEFRIVEEPVQPRAMPSLVERHLREAEQKRVSAAEELPPPPQWPMLNGVLTFPFYLNTLSSWMFITFGLMLSGWLFMFWIAYGAIGGTSTAYYIGLAACAAGLLTLGYTAACCLTIVEGTSTGWDSIEISVGIEWKEWVWDFAHIAALLLQAGIFGYVAQLVYPSVAQAFGLPDSWLPLIVGTLAVFPLVLMGALAADGAWVPMAIGTVLRSLVWVWWAWALFYLETVPMIVGWSMLTQSELAGQTPWLVPLYMSPFLAAIFLIYARLIGRLAWCISQAASLYSEGDEDE